MKYEFKELSPIAVVKDSVWEYSDDEITYGVKVLFACDRMVLFVDSYGCVDTMCVEWFVNEFVKIDNEV